MVGLSDIMDGCLGSTREVVDGEIDGGKCAQVQGKELGLMEQLMEEEVDVGEQGKEKLCMALYLPGLPGLGTHESGED